MTTSADALWRDLDRAVNRRLVRTARRRRALRLGAVCLSGLALLTSGAIASGVASDLDLAPDGWAVLREGQLDGGRASYVHAVRTDGRSSTFLVEHDDGLPPYAAFVLHERAIDAAAETSPVPVRDEPGGLCTPEQLTRAERVALGALESDFGRGAAFDSTGPAVSHAVADAFADAPCRGLAYAGEQARLVFAGTQPSNTLMPGAR